MAETGLHHLTEFSLSVRDEGVDRQGGEAIRLDRDRSVAIVLDEILERLVSQLRERLHAVHGLAQAEQSGPGRKRREKSFERAPDAGATITGEGPAGLGEGSAIAQFPPSIQRTYRSADFWMAAFALPPTIRSHQPP